MDEPSVKEKLLSSDTRTLHRPTLDVVASPYTPINLSALILNERIPFDLYLKVAQKGSQDFAYLPFSKKGEPWERQWLDLLAQKGIDRLYFLNGDMEKALTYLHKHMQLLKHESAKVTPGLLTVFSEQLNLTIRKAFHSARFGPGVHKAQTLIEGLIVSLQQDSGSLKLVWKVLYHDYNIYNHSINLCLLGMAFMLFLKKSKKESRDLGMAGLLHDIGMTRISQEIIAKEGPLTPEERTEVNQHPALGHRLLSKATSLAYVPNEVLRLTLEHHENADGSGYPLALPLSRQHSWTRIMRLLDSYESLTTNRPYRGSYKPFEAVKILREMRGTRGSIYDTATLKSFISFLTAE